MRADGFFIFLNRNYLAYFPHRREIGEYSLMNLQLPSTDDNANYNNIIFHKVWWGRLDTSFLRIPTDLDVKR
jgi:hypothetical protein